MGDLVQMILGIHRVNVSSNLSVGGSQVVIVDVFDDEKRPVQIAMSLAEAKAFHAALGAVVQAVDWEYQVDVEKAKAEWRTEE